MNKALIPTSLFFLLNFLSCSSDDPKVEKTVEQSTSSSVASPTLKRIFVVIDVSSSLNENACNHISNDVQSIFDALGEYHELRVFSTVEGTKSQPIFKWKKVSPTKPSLEKKFYNDTIPAIKKEVKEAVLTACSKGNNGSYILHAIQSVYSNIRGAEKANESMLIILSDMLECSPGYYGCSEQTKGFEKMTKGLDDTTLAVDCPLSKEIPLENVFVSVISMNLEMRYVQLSSSPACETFWNAAFIKMGYPLGSPLVTGIGKFLSKMSD